MRFLWLSFCRSRSRWLRRKIIKILNLYLDRNLRMSRGKIEVERFVLLPWSKSPFVFQKEGAPPRKRGLTIALSSWFWFLYVQEEKNTRGCYGTLLQDGQLTCTVNILEYKSTGLHKNDQSAFPCENRKSMCYDNIQKKIMCWWGMRRTGRSNI